MMGYIRCQFGRLENHLREKSLGVPSREFYNWLTEVGSPNLDIGRFIPQAGPQPT